MFSQRGTLERVPRNNTASAGNEPKSFKYAGPVRATAGEDEMRSDREAASPENHAALNGRHLCWISIAVRYYTAPAMAGLIVKHVEIRWLPATDLGSGAVPIGCAKSAVRHSKGETHSAKMRSARHIR